VNKAIQKFGIVFALSLLMSSCSIGGSDSTGLISWESCSEASIDLKCAWLNVPRIRGNNDAGDVSLNVVRSVAPSSENVEGTLIVHAGGPGIQHRFVLSNIRASLGSGFDSWDIVALDTRGTLGSHPFDCGFDVMQTIEGKIQCQNSNAFDASWSTAESIEDLEALRIALGGNRVRFLGWSYGATLGAGWVSKYPNALERVVLDAPGNPGAPWSEQLAARFSAMDRLSSQILESRAAPQDPRVRVALEMAMYDPELWTEFRLGYDGDESKIDELVSRRLGVSGGTDDGGIKAQIAVRCSDIPKDDLANVLSLAVNGANGIGIAVETACAKLPNTRPIYTSGVRNPGGIPILVVAARGDIASPFEIASKLVVSLEAELLAIDGSRHTSVGSNAEATRRAARFLLD
jgi:pimeloyl-ACP methyl ester carboxylesterase